MMRDERDEVCVFRGEREEWKDTSGGQERVNCLVVVVEIWFDGWVFGSWR